MRLEIIESLMITRSRLQKDHSHPDSELRAAHGLKNLPLDLSIGLGPPQVAC